MICPDAKTWDLLSMKLLDEDRAGPLRQHLLECELCNALWQEASRQHEEILEAFQVYDCDHDRRRDQLMALLPQSALLSKKEPDIVRWQRSFGEGGLAMTLRRHRTRWTAAASVAAACILLVFFLMSGERVVFADVLEDMRQAKSMVCEVVTKMTLTKSAPGMSFPGSEDPRRAKMSMYVDGETRALLYEMEMPEAFVVVVQSGDKDEAPPAASKTTELPQAEPSTIRTLYLDDKAYSWTGSKVQVLTSLEVNQQSGPEEWLKVLMKASKAPDRKLGEKLINGRQTVGFEIAGWKLKFGTRPTVGSPTPSDSQSVVRVWVDVAQGLPAQIEVDQLFVSPLMQGTIHSVFENIQWNVPLDPDDFQPPSEADLAQAQVVQMPSIDEATFIEFLRAWVDSAKQAQAALETLKQKADEKGEELPAQVTALAAFSDDASLKGTYPEKLDTSWLSGAYVPRLTLVRIAKTLSGQHPLPADIEENERKRLIAERAKEAAQATARIQDSMIQATTAAAFYQRLANEGREPEYFGATARPGDADAVLLKWKLDDGRYRVIYADLHIETVGTAN